MIIEVKRAELRTQLGTVESTLSGTYQVDPAGLNEQAATEGRAAESEENRSQRSSSSNNSKKSANGSTVWAINLAAIDEHHELGAAIDSLDPGNRISPHRSPPQGNHPAHQPDDQGDVRHDVYRAAGQIWSGIYKFFRAAAPSCSWSKCRR